VSARRLLPVAVAVAAVAVVVLVVLAQAGDQRQSIGIVIDVDAAGLTEVRGFTLRTDAGEELDYRLGSLENGAEFPPGHLVEHVATAEPVLVFYREEGGDRVAYRIEDAPGD
jgi:hypothetical protein